MLIAQLPTVKKFAGTFYTNFPNKNPTWTENGGSFVYGAGLEVLDNSAPGNIVSSDKKWRGRTLTIPIFRPVNNSYWRCVYLVNSKANDDRTISLDVIFNLSTQQTLGMGLCDAWANNANVGPAIVFLGKEFFSCPPTLTYNGMPFDVIIIFSNGEARAVVNGAPQSTIITFPSDVYLINVIIAVNSMVGYSQGYASVKSIETGDL